MEYFLGSVKLMLIVYALAAFISMLVAWIIKLIFSGIRRQRAAEMPAKALSKQANATPEKAA